jgi:hypothetical protein
MTDNHKDVHTEHTLAASPSPGLGFFAENANNSPASPSRCYTPIACERGCTGDCAPASPSPVLRDAVIAPDYVEQSEFIYFECRECGFDSVQPHDFNGSTICPHCDEMGRGNSMSSRICRSTDKPEGKDARALSRPVSEREDGQ